MSRRLLVLVAFAAACAQPADGGQNERAAAVSQPSEISPFARAKVEALLADRLPCLGCHQLQGTGGTIGPDLTTVSDRRSREYIERMIRDPQGTVPGVVMPRVVMPDEWVDLLSDYLAGSRDTTDVRPPTPAPLAQSGLSSEQLYGRYCAACHGESGRGDGPNAANLPVRPTPHADADLMSQRPDDSLYDAIAGGGWIMGKSSRMPPFGQTLPPDDIQALVRHIRKLCNCMGPAWSRDGRRPAGR